MKTRQGKVTLNKQQMIETSGEWPYQSFRLPIEEIEAVYVEVDTNLNKNLVLIDPFYHHAIPFSFKGFTVFYQQLSQILRGDDFSLQTDLPRGKPFKIRLWKKIKKQNYTLLEGTFEDIGKGFEVQSPEKVFISWDCPLEELKKKPVVRIRPNSFGSHTLDFTQAVRLGNIVLEDFTAVCFRDREDMPMLHFNSCCCHQQNDDQSYMDLKKALTACTGVLHPDGWERKDQNALVFSFEEIHFSLNYNYNSEHGFELGETQFHITNERPYETLLIDEAYEAGIQVSDYVILPEKIYIQGNYKKNKRVKRYPQKLAEITEGRVVIWYDQPNKKIGFAGNKKCQVFDEDEIESIGIANTLPAKGAGRADLTLEMKEREYNNDLLSGSCYAFDKSVHDIQKITGKEVQFLPESMDC